MWVHRDCGYETCLSLKSFIISNLNEQFRFPNPTFTTFDNELNRTLQLDDDNTEFNKGQWSEDSAGSANSTADVFAAIRMPEQKEKVLFLPHFTFAISGSFHKLLSPLNSIHLFTNYCFLA